MDINIAVCDDSKETCAQVEKVLDAILRQKDIQHEIDVFYTGEGLCRELSRTSYDLIFLDIELPGMNGVETGKYIRNTVNDEKVQIAYISSKQGYAMELFDVRPIDFLIKPLSRDRLESIINKYVRITSPNQDRFTYKKSYDFYRVKLSDVLFFKSDGRKVIIVMLNGKDEFYDTLNNVYSRVKNNKFLYVHKSVIVNYNFIKKYTYSRVTMINGEEFKVSQSRQTIIRDMYIELEEEEMK